jgi:hypothetical protein
VQDTVSIILFNVLPQLIDILVACTYLASALKGPWVALIVLFTVGSYVPLTLLITEQRGKVRAAADSWQCAAISEQYWLQLSVQAWLRQGRAAVRQAPAWLLKQRLGGGGLLRT